MSSRECFNRSFSLPRIFVSIYSSSSPRTHESMKGRRRRAPFAAPTDTTLVPSSYNPLSPQLPPLSFRCFPHGQRGHVPVVMETRANRDGNSTMALSLQSPSLSFSFSLCSFHLSFSGFRPRFIYAPFSLLVISKLSLAPSCSFLPPGGLSVCPLPPITPLRNQPSPTLASQSPGLVSLTQRAPNRNGKRTDALGEALPS